jgi:mono/diheme cytochrome c family protein
VGGRCQPAFWAIFIYAAEIAVLLASMCVTSRAREDKYPGIELTTGRQIYEAACLACHGPTGQGMPESVVGFKKPSQFPDFTDCSSTTSELNNDYKAVVVNGGPFRGFSQIMPAYGQALTNKQIDEVIKYVRGFCTNPHWPRGELNMPRALITEKAYPEDEAVVTEILNAKGAAQATTQNVYEQRFGVKNELEVTVPFSFANQNHTWYGGFEDSTLGIKREIWSSLAKGAILTVQGEVSLPAGSVKRGFGSGVTQFSPYLEFDQLFPSQTFIEFQGGADLPVNTRIAPDDLTWYTVLGQNFQQSHGLGRLWSPMVELLVTRDLQTGASTSLDLIPQFEVTLSKRQHVRGDVGVRIPTLKGSSQGSFSSGGIQVLFYVLWDFQEGKITHGW